MKNDWTLSQEDFDRLLRWLDPDRDQAGKKYEELRKTLIKTVAWRGYDDGADVADEVFNRVTKLLPTIGDNYEGEPAAYCLGVLRIVLKEHGRNRAKDSTPITWDPIASSSDGAELREERSRCLDRCLKTLNASDRDLMLSYYAGLGAKRTQLRSELAKKLRIGVGNLRVKMHRLRTPLRDCVLKCLESDSGVETN